MQLVNPWENIKIEKLNTSELYYFDNDIHLLFVLIGDVSIQDSDQLFVLQKDDFLVVPKGEKILIQNNNAEVFTLTLSYDFPLNTKDNDIEYIFQGNSIEKQSTVNNEIRKYIHRLLQLFVYKEYNQNAFAFQNYFALIGNLEKHFRKKETMDRKKSTTKKIEEIKFYIDNNFQKDIKLADVANNLYLSEQYISRVFSKEVGLSISDYLVQKRLEKVRNELLHTEKSVIEIAYDVGFSNINSFNRIFKKYQGLTPTDYRKEVKQSIVVLSNPVEEEETDLADLKKLIDTTTSHEGTDTYAIQISNEKSFESYAPTFLINLGFAQDLLRKDFHVALARVKKDGPFTYGRIWGLLSPEIIGCDPDQLDFSQTNQILDAILDADLIPFLELGFKGKTIYKDYTSILANQVFSKNSLHLEAYLKTIALFLKHCINRYGRVAVEKWQIEIWKPHPIVLQAIQAPFLGEVFYDDTRLKITRAKDFYCFFTKISEQIKKILPNMKVGGCGISVDIKNSDENFPTFIELWLEQKQQPDFFSLAVYPMDEIKSDFTEQRRSNPISPDMYFMSRHVKAVKKIFNRLQADIPIYITEFNVTIANRDLINDTAYKGSYIIKNAIEVSPYCKVIGYWLLSDISAVAVDCQEKEVFGGAGLLTRHAIPKIGYYAFLFLAKMTGRTLYYNEELLVTMPDPYTINILAISYAHLNSAYYYNSQGTFRKENVYAVFNNMPDKKFRVTIDLPEINKRQQAKITTQQIGLKNGTHLEEMAKIAIETLSTREEEAYLQAQSLPKMWIEHLPLGEKLTIEFAMETHDLLFKRIVIEE
ncbi:GH39 family glycosyl hydrolase [Enterococcus casseliflavus]|uniref:GH39 family glycosyl hydrolase n=1 Tax=Enterococcus casseliflavus TaxID=37734 RepID=UPI0039A456BA